jgi:membrane protease YdiL (CAAX protease family)
MILMDPEPFRRRVKWSEVMLFLGTTFILTFLLDLGIWLSGGLNPRPALGILLQLQMLLPAFSAIFLGLFVFEGGPMRQMREHGGRPLWFYYYFLGYAVTYALLGAVISLGRPEMGTAAAGAAQLLTILGLVLLIAVRIRCGDEETAQAGLSWGRPIYWLLFGGGFILFYSLQTALNYLFGLGAPVDAVQILIQIAPGQKETFLAIGPTNLLLLTAAQSVLLAPFLALVIAFGEEYGWRSYLQSELIKMGRTRGVLLLGAIWGLWHWPLILMGYNYPGYPVLGTFLMTAYAIGLSVVLGYAVLKSGSVLLAAFLHALNNQTISSLTIMVYKPIDPVFSFGIGIYGLICLAAVAILILRDPIWRED